MLVLSLKDYRVAQVRRTHPAFANTRLLGRGTFCAVFETPKPDRVLKLTTDRAHVDYLVDGCAPQGAYKPEVLVDHGEVGETSDGIPMYLLEVERLEKVRRGTPNGTLVTRIVRFTDQERHYPEEANLVKGLSQALADFMCSLNWFITNFPQMFRDAKFDNFMQRSDGTLVLNDPVYDRKLLDQARLRRSSY